MPKLPLAALALAASPACSTTGTPGSPAAPPPTVVPASEVEWSPLNPARGDKGPKAGNLWGDRTGAGAAGFLVEFVDGFESPPHVHNVSYRGVVISGLVHNDDPGAAEMWLPAGSYWTQPRGAVHLTSAQGRRNRVYVEIDEGPYLVLPVEDEFDSGEAPINVDASNLVWLDLPGAPASAEGPHVSYLWGDPRGERPNGSLLRLPAGFAGTMRSHGSSLRAVVIQGRLELRMPGETDVRILEPGSHFGSSGEASPPISRAADGECLLYVRAQGELDVLPARLVD